MPDSRRPAGPSAGALRREYGAGRLRREQLLPDPVDQFALWFEDAGRAGLPEPNAACLSTASAAGRPSGRMILLKGWDTTGLLFATNYSSRKAAELAENPAAALLVFWQQLERQVRIEGTVRRATDAESDAIHAARPRGSQLAAWASPQSREIPPDDWLEKQLQDVAQRFPETVPRPDFWGAFRLCAERFEFWQGGRDRLHDRFVYTRDASGVWAPARLAP